MPVNYDWRFGRLLPYWHAFLSGTEITIGLTAVVIVCGTALGCVVGVCLRRQSLRIVLYPLVDVLRALPPLVLILFFYYVLTEQIIGFTVTSFWTAVVAMSLNLAAFTGEIVRSAFDAVPKSSLDAGRALGLSRRQLQRHVILPHVLRESIPAMTVLYIGVLKMSSLASVINVREVVYTAETVITGTTRSLESWAVVAAIYVVLVVPMTYFARRVELLSGRRAHVE